MVENIYLVKILYFFYNKFVLCFLIEVIKISVKRWRIKIWKCDSLVLYVIKDRRRRVYYKYCICNKYVRWKNWENVIKIILLNIIIGWWILSFDS